MPDSQRSLLAAMRALYAHLTPERRRMFVVLIVLLVLGAIAEILTIASVFPFLAVLAPGEMAGPQSQLIARYREWISSLGYDPVWFSAWALIGFALISAAFRMAINWLSMKFTFMAGYELAARLIRRTFAQPYSFHIEQNSSSTLSQLERVQYVLAYVIMPAILAFTSAGVAIVILAALVALEPVVALGAGVFLAVIYLSVSFATRRKLNADSAVISRALKTRVQVLQEGLGGIRDLILDSTQAVFLQKFDDEDWRFRRAQTTVYFITAAPRFVVEACAIVLIALIGLYIHSKPGGLIGALPMLGAFAVGAQRLLPMVQQVYASWSQVMGNRVAMDDVIETLGSPDEKIVLPRPDSVEPLPFRKSIQLAGVSFRYPSGEHDALAGVDLEIPRGSRIGLIGKSGSGKSTLVDLLMGLVEPSSGTVLVDGKPVSPDLQPRWQRQVAHVPQAIFLADMSVASNIAFGRLPQEIDMQRVRQAAREAELDEFIRSLPKGYDTHIGERGVRLSGGQRQRLGIARALYKRASLLVLDEATSALDDSTESSVMRSIAALSSDLTIVMIAHRVTTLQSCDEIYEMKDGRIARVGSYKDVMRRRSA